MNQEFTEMANGDLVPVFCVNCHEDLRKVGIINECTFIAQYEYHWEGNHFDAPEDPDSVVEEHFCAACEEPVKVESHKETEYWLPDQKSDISLK